MKPTIRCKFMYLGKNFAIKEGVQFSEFKLFSSEKESYIPKAVETIWASSFYKIYIMMPHDRRPHGFLYSSHANYKGVVSIEPLLKIINKYSSDISCEKCLFSFNYKLIGTCDETYISM